MAQNNLAQVQHLLEHFATTGEPSWDDLHTEVVVHDHDIVDARDYRGYAGVERWMEDWAAAWSEYTIEPEEFFDADEHVVASIRQKAIGYGSGATLEREDAIVFAFRDGKIARVDYYNSRDQALQAAGIAAS